MRASSLVLLFFLQIGPFCLVIDGQEHLEAFHFDHRLQLDDKGAFVLFWTVHDRKEVTFEVHVKTLGYFGFGFSSKGGMKQADLVIGWVTEEGGQVFHDRWSVRNAQPVIDKKQNWLLINGLRNESHTVFRFKRDLDTCDEKQDLKIEDGTMKAIWAYGPRTPATAESVYYHGGHRRGSKHIIVLSFPSEEEYSLKKRELGTMKTWDILARNVTISGQDTSYRCWTVKAPVTNRKHHVIALEPVIVPGHERYVHHYLLWVCRHENTSLFEERLQEPDHECYFANMPSSSRHCEHMYAVWSIGGGTQFFPKKAGLPLGEWDSTYFLMEIHYDNPSEESFVDSSGWRLHYTRTLRDFDAYTQDVHAQWDTIVIPPGQPDFKVVAACDPQCTSSMDESGITAFAAYLHSHLLGRKISGRHFRDGSELEPFSVDNNYDFNYQEIRYFKDKTILPGDVLTVECTYDSSTRTRVTLGGTSTRDEMCSMFFYYYPKMDNSGPCLSGLTRSGLLAALGLESLEDGSQDIVALPKVHEGKTWRQFAEEKSSWSPNDVDQVRNAFLNQKQKTYCHVRENELSSRTVPSDLLAFPGDNGYHELSSETKSSCQVNRN